MFPYFSFSLLVQVVTKFVLLYKNGNNIFFSNIDLQKDLNFHKRITFKNKFAIENRWLYSFRTSSGYKQVWPNTLTNAPATNRSQPFGWLSSRFAISCRFTYSYVLNFMANSGDDLSTFSPLPHQSPRTPWLLYTCCMAVRKPPALQSVTYER